MKKLICLCIGLIALQTVAVHAQSDEDCRLLLQLAKEHYMQLGEKATLPEFDNIFDLCGGSIAAEAKAFLREQRNNKKPVETITVKGVTFKMILVKGGTFQMGSNDGYDWEKPVHNVTLSDYYIAETEVTQELWEAVMGSNPSYFKGGRRPVEQVSWQDCQAFIEELNYLTGRHFRLPTEAEWEYAARGGNRSGHYTYSGGGNIDAVGWYSGNSGKETHNVATKRPNELGLYDMTGNVWEWCQDWYGSYSSGSATNPKGPSSGQYRVPRGGSWDSDAAYGRVSLRSFCTPSGRHNDLGFRLVCPK